MITKEKHPIRVLFLHDHAACPDGRRAGSVFLKLKELSVACEAGWAE
jgi:hypothetical protein